ncbi:hypothetical protein KL920_003738 [Ogataea angusta]|nr:hypothetical protein KL920_003738 [Ogataea angusta]
MAMSDAVKELLWLKQLMKELSVLGSYVPILFGDNTSSISLAKHPTQHQRTKHIDIRYHFIRDHILKGDLQIEHVDSQSNIADLLTKQLVCHIPLISEGLRYTKDINYLIHSHIIEGNMTVDITLIKTKFQQELPIRNSKKTTRAMIVTTAFLAPNPNESSHEAEKKIMIQAYRTYLAAPIQ